MSKQVITVQKAVMASDEEHAAAVREYIKGRGNFLFINIIGSPGCGKTTLLEHIAAANVFRFAVIEGDIETSRDAERLAAVGVFSHQLNTHGGCHLEAHSIERALKEDMRGLDELDLLIVENVGNLVCPAEFDIGEDFKLAVLSTPEGADKPLKYPLLFTTAKAVILTKTDLLPYVDFDMEMFKRDMAALNPRAPIFMTDMKTGGGVDELTKFISAEIKKKRV